MMLSRADQNRVHKEWERIVSNAFVGERGKNFLGNKNAFDEVVNSSNFL